MYITARSSVKANSSLQLALKVTFDMRLLFCFLSLKKSTFDTGEMFFLSHQKLVLFLKYSNFANLES